MKKEFRLKLAFGSNEAGLADLPKKISGIRISRILIGEEMGCSRCFPHGYETSPKGLSHSYRWLKIKPSEILFLDDNSQNVSQAISMGMQSICVKNSDEAMDTLRKLMHRKDHENQE